jgi:hypothetical protein
VSHDLGHVGAHEAIERITAHQRKAGGDGGVRRLTAAWCDRGDRKIAGVYVVDDQVWMWLERLRFARSYVPAELLPDGITRDGFPRRVVWLRDVATPHPPGCRCEPVGAQWVTCRCCSADQRVTYWCSDELETAMVPPPMIRTHDREWPLARRDDAD